MVLRFVFFQVNNAGMIYHNSIGTITEEKYDVLFNCNVKSHVFLTQLAIPYLIKTKGVLDIIYVKRTFIYTAFKYICTYNRHIATVIHSKSE